MPHPRSPARLAIATLSIGVLAAVAIARVRKRLRRYAIAEHSMRPALRAGDWVLARRLSGPPQRGDIVVFGHPGRSDFELVKRVVGLPGEHVGIDTGEVRVDGRAADTWATGPTLPDGSWRLGPDEVFVLGDNRAMSSADSRTLGPIPTAATGWVILCRYRPLPLRRFRSPERRHILRLGG
jgi:signal peptidase I